MNKPFEASFVIEDWKQFAGKPIAFYISKEFWEYDLLIEDLTDDGVHAVYRLEQMLNGQRVDAGIFYLQNGMNNVKIPEIAVLKHKTDIYNLLEKGYVIAPIDLLGDPSGCFIYTIFGHFNFEEENE